MSKIVYAISLIIPFLSYSSFAAVTITSITGVSFSDPSTGTSAQTVYGGMAGTCSTTSATSTCNSCIDTTSNPPTACNLKSVHPSLIISVNYTVTAPTAGTPTVYLRTDSPTGSTPLQDLNNSTFPASLSGTITTTWGDLCSKDTNFTASCLPSAPGSPLTNFTERGLSIEVDLDGDTFIEDGEKVRVPIKFQYVDSTLPAANGQPYESPQCTGVQKGACGFELKPGDEKVFLDSFAAAGAATSPTNDAGAPAWYGLVFFKVSGSGASSSQVSNASSEPIVRLYDSTFRISDSSLSGGFENYVKTCLVMGNINKAQNIYYFTQANDDTKTCVVPSEVVGLLDDKSCFISTAAFGSDMAPEVETFRQFRNHYLLSNEIGREFVKLYYQLSPPAAEIISQSDFLKSVTRAVLTPVLLFAKSALRFGILESLLGLMCLFILISQVGRFVYQNKRVLPVIILFFVVVAKADIEPKTQMIKHPGAKEGLIKIRKDGSYIYDVSYEVKNESSHIRFGQAMQPEISIVVETVDATNTVIGSNTLNFDDFYSDASNFIFTYDYEYFPWVEKSFLGLQLGVGLMYADGNGRLKLGTPGDPNPIANEKYTFLTIPMNVGAVYRFQYSNQPWFAPYVSGGGTYVGLAEKREDKAAPSVAGGFGFYGAGGVLVNISRLNAETAFELNSEYGIGNLWFSIEARVTEVNSEQFTFSNRYINGGISFDF